MHHKKANSENATKLNITIQPGKPLITPTNEPESVRLTKQRARAATERHWAHYPMPFSTRTPNFDFEKWIIWRLSPHIRSGYPESTETKVITMEQLIIDLAYDYDRATDVGSRKATAMAKRILKDSPLLTKHKNGVCLTGRTPIRRKQ